jgi:hypothetical protein
MDTQQKVPWPNPMQHSKIKNIPGKVPTNATYPNSSSGKQ